MGGGFSGESGADRLIFLCVGCSSLVAGWVVAEILLSHTMVIIMWATGDSGDKEHINIHLKARAARPFLSREPYLDTR